MLIDSHAHVNFGEFEQDWQQVLDDCLQKNIWVINVGSQLATSRRGIEIAEQYPAGVFAAVSLHPIHVEGSSFHPESFNTADFRQLISSSKKVVAVGETGIDFYHLDSNFEKQKEVFIEHINLAKEFNLPLIVHGRDSRDKTKSAYQAILQILKAEHFNRGVIHCFGGTLKDATDFLAHGFHIGFTGVITFDKTGVLKTVIEHLPLESILVETDCPFLAPVPYRGKRNQPQYVQYVAEKVAEFKNVSYTEVANQTVTNTINLFNLPTV